MKSKDLMMWAALGIGGYLLYKYLDEQGYIDGWFGGFGGNAVAQGQQQGQTQPVINGTPVPSYSQPSYQQPTPQITGSTAPTAPTAGQTQAATNTLRDQIWSAVQGNPALVNGRMDAHNWNWYQNQLGRELSPQEFGSAFPNGSDMNQMTLDEFMSALQSAGLAGMRRGRGVGGLRAIVPTASAPQVPSMSFGGNIQNNRPAKRGPRNSNAYLN